MNTSGVYGIRAQWALPLRHAFAISLVVVQESAVWEWGGKIAQMFRVSMDHLPFWSLPKAVSGGDGAGYGQGTKEIIEWMAALQPSRISAAYRSGHCRVPTRPTLQPATHSLQPSFSATVLPHSDAGSVYVLASFIAR